MKRFLIAGLMALALGVPLTAGASAPPRAHLRGFVCQHALDPAAREVSVVAVMRPLLATKKMELRFDLLTKTSAAGSFAAVSGGDLGTWISPKNSTLGQRPGDTWIISHPVVQLSAPASYRFRVSFRWTGAHGHLLGSAQRLGPQCFQPELRPDLLVQSILVKPIAGRPKLNRYIATIGNAGATAAGPFEVLFADGVLVSTHPVGQLAAHTTQIEKFVGPACNPAAPPQVTVDPNQRVDDFNRANNSLTVTCPGP